MSLIILGNPVDLHLLQIILVMAMEFKFLPELYTAYSNEAGFAASTVADGHTFIFATT